MHLARKESPSRDRSFERFLLRAVDEELSSLADSLAKQRFYLYLEKEFNVNRHDIPRKLEEFAAAIEKIFGEGAKFLEFQIMKRLHEKVGHLFSYFPERNDLTFTDYVATAKSLCHRDGLGVRKKKMSSFL